VGGISAEQSVCTASECPQHGPAICLCNLIILIKWDPWRVSIGSGIVPGRVCVYRPWWTSCAVLCTLCVSPCLYLKDIPARVNCVSRLPDKRIKHKLFCDLSVMKNLQKARYKLSHIKRSYCKVIFNWIHQGPPYIHKPSGIQKDLFCIEEPHAMNGLLH